MDQPIVGPEGLEVIDLANPPYDTLFDDELFGEEYEYGEE
jgi:hypothetical protein